MDNKIRERREELGLSQEELAKRANVSRQTVSLLETNKADNVTIKTMTAIAHALDATTEQIFLP